MGATSTGTHDAINPSTDRTATGGAAPMLASPAIPARRGLFTPVAPAVVGRDIVATEEQPRLHVIPRAPWSRGHRTFRGTRVLTAAALTWTGAILVAFGAMIVPAAHDAGGVPGDPGLMHLLGSVAPWITGLGIVTLIAAVGAARDRRWWTGLGTWVLAGGAMAILAALVLALAGRDPFALSTAGSPAGQGLGILVWTLALLGIAGWGVRRVARARELTL
jgi:hypothetical protein